MTLSKRAQPGNPRMKRETSQILDAIHEGVSMLELVRNDGVEMHRSGPNHVGFCPFHVENTPSFTIHADDQHAHCYGCGWHGDQIAYLQVRRNLDFIAARNLAATTAGLALPSKEIKKSRGKPAAIYDYLDENGKLLHQTLRYDPKRFLQSRPAAPGEYAGGKQAKRDKQGRWWLWTLHGWRTVLYNLPQILAALPEAKIYIVEGERDADNLNAAFLREQRITMATTCPMGAGKWRAHYNESLNGRHAVLVPDFDEPGRLHMQAVGTAIYGIAASVSIVNWHELWPERTLQAASAKVDISDYLEAFPGRALPI